MSSNIAELLSAYNDTNLSDIWIPSTNETVKFKPIIAAHQQTLLKRLGESSFEMAAFSLALTDIIKSTATTILDPNKYTSLDKSLIALQLRMHNISEEIDATLSEDDAKALGLDNATIKVHIPTFVESLRGVNKPSPVLVVNDGTVKVILGVPTMADEMTFAAYIQSTINKLTDNNKKELDPQAIIGDLVLGTFATFIDEITIRDQTAIFANLPGETRIQYTKLLNRRLTDACNEHVTALSEFGKLYTVFRADGPDGTTYPASLNIDARMFVES